ncbi:MAG: hypothetical protein K9I94_00080 [Bacteroidales bacterium]|nr:hypothetical protein [Bacteroidales bacterium]
MTTISSEKKRVNVPLHDLYTFMADLRNYEQLMPEQVEGWSATAEECAFSVKNLGSLSLRIESKEPDSRINIQPDGSIPFDMSMACFLNKAGEKSANIQIVISAEMSPMYKMMAERPLNNLVNIMVEKLEQADIKPQ